MALSFFEIGNQLVTRVEIDCSGVAASKLTAQLNDALNQAEDRGPNTIMLMHGIGNVVSRCHQWPEDIDVQSLTEWECVLRRIERTPLITIALAEHACSGLALDLFLVVDRRLASEDFSTQYIRTDGSIWPSMALYRLSRQIGNARVRKLFFESPYIDASLALKVDIVDELVDGLSSGITRIAYLLAHAPLRDFAVRRRLMEESLSTSFEDALGVHLAACTRSAAIQEGKR